MIDARVQETDEPQGTAVLIGLKPGATTLAERIDLNQFNEGQYHVEVKRAEDPKERDHRLALAKAEAEHQRWKDQWIFTVGLGSALVIGGGCLWVFLDQSFSASQQTVATSILTSMITGIVGYLFGKASK